MSDLPAGWIETPLEKVVEILDSRRSPINAQEREKRIAGKKQEELFPYYGATGQVGYIDDYLFDEPLILFGEDGVPFLDPMRPKAYLVDGKYWVNNHAHALKAIDGVSDRRYLCAFLNAFDYREKVTGTTRLKLTQEAMRSIQVSLAPLNEQKRIAEKLDSLLARVDSCQTHLERVPQILKRFRQSVLAAATSGRLTEEWREESIEWEAITLGELCENSFYGPRFGKNEYTNSEKGIPTIRTTDMTSDGKIEITKDTPRILVPSEKLDLYKVRKGDLLITRTGSIGVMAVFEEDYTAIPSAYLIRFRFFSRILPRFAFYCLMAPYGQAQLGLSIRAITQPNVNAESIKKIEIQLPSLEEQAEIVRRVESLFAYAERIEARYASASQHVERLTPSLLAKAFRGELVEQNPNDESAEKLLERIKEAIAKAPKESKKSQRRTTMKSTKSKQDGKRISIVQALQEAGKALSSEQLFAAAGFPSDAEPDLVEEFFVEIRDALKNKQITRERKGDLDWFSLAK